MAVLVLYITLPLFYAAGAVLVQTTPPSIMAGALDKTLREARFCDGVLGIVDHRFWALVPGSTVGTLHVKVSWEHRVGRGFVGVTFPLQRVTFAR